MASDPRGPGVVAATLTIAVLTWRRLIRGRALWVSLLIAGMPIIYASAARGDGRHQVGDELFMFEVLVLVVLAPMFVASSIGEEIEDRTITYLWSRPVPRWTVLAGKLVTLVPLTLAIVLGSWLAATRVGWDALPSVRSCLALAAGTAALAMLATAMATLSPRHGMALTIVYMLFFDLPLGVLPATLRTISASYQIRSLSGVGPVEGAPSTLTAVIMLTVIATVWASISALRIRRLEA